MKKSQKFIFLTILALTFLGLWLWLVDLEELVYFLGRVNLALLSPILLVMILRSLMTAYRMKILMTPIGKASVFYFWGLSFLGRITTLLVPFQGGAFLRTYLMKKKFRSSFSTCFAIVFFDLLLGVGVNFVFSLWAVVDRGVSVNPAFWILGAVLLAGTILVVRGILSCYSKESVCRGAPPGWGNWQAIRSRLARAFSNFKLGLSLISKNRPLLPAAIFISLIIFLLTNLRMYFIFSAFGAEIPFIPIVLAGALFGLSGFLPGMPIKIGQYELLGLLIYAYFLNLDKNLVAAAILFSHLLAVSFSLFGGFIASVSLGIKPNLQQK